MATRGHHHPTVWHPGLSITSLEKRGRLGGGSRRGSLSSQWELPAAELNSLQSQETWALVGSSACSATVFPSLVGFSSPPPLNKDLDHSVSFPAHGALPGSEVLGFEEIMP